jgi:hypothetical protein
MSTRCSRIVGPCKIVTCDATYVSVGDVKLSIKRDTRKLESSIAGKVGETLNKTVVEVKFKPIPLPSYASTLFPFQPSDIGKSVFGCTDCSMQIHGADGIKVTLKAVGAIGTRTLAFGRKKDLYSDVTFRAVVADATDIATLDNLAAISSSAFTAPSSAYQSSDWVARAATVTYLGRTAKTFTAATTDVISCTAHGLLDGDTIQVSSAGTLPAGLTALTVYYVRDKTTDTFKVALTSGGTAIDITDTGTGTHSFRKSPAVASITVDDGVEITINYETDDKEDDLNGHVDTRLKGITCTAKFAPNNLSVAQIRNLLPWDGPNAKPGLNLGAIGYQLTVGHSPSAGGLQCLLPIAVPTDTELTWGMSADRDGDITMAALQGYDTDLSAPLALYAISTP